MVRLSFMIFLFLFLCATIPLAVLSFQSGSRNTRQLLAIAATNKGEYGVDAPYAEANYDPHAAAIYYKDRPIESISRLAKIVTKSSGFIISDSILGEEKVADQQQRSEDLLNLVSDLGPTFSESLFYAME